MSTPPKRPDLKAALLADLQDAASARPLPDTGGPLARPAAPLEPGPGPRPPTPVLDIQVTPLRWSLPRVVGAGTGLGFGLRVGPLRVSVALA